MRNPLRLFTDHLYYVSKGLLFLCALIIILLFFPREGKFKYEYVKGKPWLHEDLIAPFDFSVLKTDEEYELQKERLLAKSRLYFTYQPEVTANQRVIVAQALIDFLMMSPSDTLSGKPIAEVYRKAIQIADTIFRHGIIQMVPELIALPSGQSIMIVKGNIATEAYPEHFFTVQSADAYIVKHLSGIDSAYRRKVRQALEMGLAHNIRFDKELTEKSQRQLLANLSRVKGLIQQGEKVISKGEVVDEEKFQVLESLRIETEKRLGTGHARFAVFIGQLILVSLAMLVLGLFLYFFRPHIFADNHQVGLILLIIISMVGLTSLVLSNKPLLLYAIPVCMVPLIARIFFDTRVALYVHIITIILIGFLVPNSFEFIFLQLISGLITIFSVANFHKQQQFVITAIYVFLAYSAVYFGLYLIQKGHFSGLKSFNFALFGGASALLLLSYPVVYVLEKAFGMLTDITLLEISDVNYKPLKELSSRAPGTFHHSIQVANLAEEVIHQIGGNPLLVRAGALYHDIGKMDMPMYFIENQYTGFNPHEELSPEESAEIILNHVRNGIEKARKYRLPEQIIDFIRTHHGTRRVEYFYRISQQMELESEVNEQAFTYPGPVPFSKETCVLMMADSVEAASRSLHQTDETHIETLVEQLIDSMMKAHQFDNSNITLKDISQAKKIFKQRLLHIYHLRIEYPT